MWLMNNIWLEVFKITEKDVQLSFSPVEPLGCGVLLYHH